MKLHDPNSLNGPVSKDRAWWIEEEATVAVETPAGAGDIRTELVERVRREIAAGTYETEDKLEIALARMFHDLDQV
jgi:anti-sigma28 factor (negative regulator of flagellin synthesis)